MVREIPPYILPVDTDNPDTVTGTVIADTPSVLAYP